MGEILDAGTVPAVSTKKRDVTCARAQARKAPVPDRRLEGDRLTVAGETGLRLYLERDLPAELDIYDVRRIESRDWQRKL